MSANDNSYNGRANWETWNLKLWLDNDEGTYREVQRMLRRSSSVENLEDQLKGFCIEVFPDGTPDMDGAKDLFAVDWTEIAEALWSEREEDND